MLRGLVSLLNNPEITGAVKEATDAEPVIVASPVTPSSKPVDLPVVAAPSPNSVRLAKTVGPVRLMLTGHSGSGKSWLAAAISGAVLEFSDPIVRMARIAFGTGDGSFDTPEKLRRLRAVVREVLGWGDGVINDDYGLTAVRMLFIDNIRSTGESGGLFFGISPKEFGTPGFWIRSLLARVAQHEKNNPARPAVVTDVTTEEQYLSLRKAGFLPYHVMCNNVTRSARGGAASVLPLNANIERDLLKKISSSPKGNKLWCVWCDDKYPPTSSRLLTTDEFIQTFGFVA